MNSKKYKNKDEQRLIKYKRKDNKKEKKKPYKSKNFFL